MKRGVLTSISMCINNYDTHCCIILSKHNTAYKQLVMDIGVIRFGVNIIML